MVTSGTVIVFLAGSGSLIAGVAAPEGATDPGRVEGALGAGGETKMSTVYAGVSELVSRGAAKTAVWSTSS